MEKLVTLIFIYIFVVRQDVVSRASNNSIERNSTKIISGFRSSEQQFPYQVHLLIFAKPKDYQCGGSIISRRHVLTSALCLEGASTIIARLGNMSSGKEYSSRNFKSHPLYNPITTDYNVGFVRFRKFNVDGINTKIIPLAPKRSSVEPETILTVSSWGEITEDDDENSIANAVRVISNTECRQFYLMTSRMFCAGEPEISKESSKIHSASGDPAVSPDGVQRGLVSLPTTDLRPGIPGIYTRVGNEMIRSWIKTNTGV